METATVSPTLAHAQQTGTTQADATRTLRRLSQHARIRPSPVPISDVQRAAISTDKITDAASAQEVLGALRAILVDHGRKYLMDETERGQFIEAYHGLYADDEDGDTSFGQRKFQQESKFIQGIVAEHPELNGIPVPDLVAVREWTGDKLWPKVQNLIENDITESNWEEFGANLPLAKALISGLNALPESYAYKGKVYTGEDQRAEWVASRYKTGQPRVDFRFFATSKTEEGKWQGRNVNWETDSVVGKSIQLLSHNKKEDEVLLVPGARHTGVKVETNPTNDPDYPEIAIRQRQRD